MSPNCILQRLRLFLLVLAGLLCVGTVVELLFAEHTESLVQWIPFILCGLGLIVVAAVLIRPQRGTLLLLRGVMGVLVLGSLFGMFEHIEHNLEFALEIRPNAAVGDVFWEALGGANPLLAPGILALAALLALAATYYHPVFTNRKGVIES